MLAQADTFGINFTIVRSVILVKIKNFMKVSYTVSQNNGFYIQKLPNHKVLGYNN